MTYFPLKETDTSGITSLALPILIMTLGKRGSASYCLHLLFGWREWEIITDQIVRDKAPQLGGGQLAKVGPSELFPHMPLAFAPQQKSRSKGRSPQLLSSESSICIANRARWGGQTKMGRMGNDVHARVKVLPKQERV